MGLRLKLIYQRVCKIFIGKENKPDLDGKIHYFSVQRTGDQLVMKKKTLNEKCRRHRDHNVKAKNDLLIAADVWIC